MPVRARICLAVVVMVAIAAVFALPWRNVSWSAFAVLAVFYPLFQASVKLRERGHVKTDVSFAIVLAGVILLPPAPAGVIAALGALSTARSEHREVSRLVFNGAQFALSAAAGSAVFRGLGGKPPTVASGFPHVLLPVIAASITVFVLNLTFVGLMVGLTYGTSLTRFVRDGVAGIVVTYFGYGLIGLLMAVLWSGSYGALAIFLVPLPLYVASWAFAQYSAEQAAYEATIRTLVRAVEIKDWYTRGHSERVATASEMIAKRLNLPEDRVTTLRYAGILHDIGKLGVPTRLLQKTGPLTDDELAAIRLHPARGVDVIRDIAFLGEAYAGIMHHHERLDGRGYPSGLAGDRIPEFARIIAVADAFDSMTSTRSYRGARPVPDAVEELWRCAGTQFDPAMVRAFTDALEAARTPELPDGWQPARPQPMPAGTSVTVSTFDHDDPTFVEADQPEAAAAADDDPVRAQPGSVEPTSALLNAAEPESPG
jgi:hypothetical protein